MTLTKYRRGTRIKIDGEIVSNDSDHYFVRVRGIETPIKVNQDILSPADKPNYALNDVDFIESRTSLAQNIRKYRQRANLSQAMLAEMIGVSQNAISQWETDMCSPRTYMLPVLSAVLSVPIDTLIGVDKEPAAT